MSLVKIKLVLFRDVAQFGRASALGKKIFQYQHHKQRLLENIKKI